MTTPPVQEHPAFNVYDPSCPARTMLDHLASRWGVLVLGALAERTHRFSELRHRLGGVSDKMLTQTLRTLEADGLLTRTVFPQIPPRVEYSLTPVGQQAAGHVTALLGWIEQVMPDVLAARKEFAPIQ